MSILVWDEMIISGTLTDTTDYDDKLVHKCLLIPATLPFCDLLTIVAHFLK